MKRTLDPELITFITSALTRNAIAQNAIHDSDCRTLLVEVAKLFVGVKEATGHNDGKVVEQFQKTCGGRVGQSYCMYFVQTCIAYVELVTRIESPIIADGYCTDVWNAATPYLHVQAIPLHGAIAIWKHAGSDKGHTGIVVSADHNMFYTIEGNTSSGIDVGGKIVSDGQGVYFKKRDMHPSGELMLRGFLKTWVTP